MRLRAQASTLIFALMAGVIPARLQIQAQNPQSAPTDPVAPVSGKGMGALLTGLLKVIFGDKTSEWTPATLAALPHTTLTVFNGHTKTSQTYSGVPLIELLKPLGAPDAPHGKGLQLYLVAEGADGYKVVYSLAEVTPDVHDGTVIVADSLEGKPLGEEGPLKLVSTGEKRPARWVRNLTAIRILTAP